jgi:hypothetical protein
MQTILVLDVNPQLGAEIVDFLLTRPFVQRFNSQDVRSHSVTNIHSNTEKVQGWRKRMQFHVILPKDNVSQLLEELLEVTQSDVEWWLQTLSAQGSFC